MKKSVFISSLLSLFTLAGCLMCESFPFKYTCSIKAEREYIVQISKQNLFLNHFESAHGYSLPNEENFNDSLYYIYCPGHEARSAAIFECVIKAVDSTSTKIRSYKVAWFSILSDKKLELYYKNLSSSEYLKLFEKNFITPLNKISLKTKFFQDNKRVYDLWESNNKFTKDSLAKASSVKTPSYICELCYKFSEHRDSSTSIAFLLSDIKNSQTSTHIRYKGMSVCYCKLSTLKKISGLDCGHKIDKFGIDTSAIDFYTEWARRRGFVKSK